MLRQIPTTEKKNAGEPDLQDNHTTVPHQDGSLFISGPPPWLDVPPPIPGLQCFVIAAPAHPSRCFQSKLGFGVVHSYLSVADVVSRLTSRSFLIPHVTLAPLQVVGPKADQARIPGIQVALGEGDVWRFGDLEVKCYDTPGHTRGHVTYYVPEAKSVFPGRCLQLDRRAAAPSQPPQLGFLPRPRS